MLSRVVTAVRDVMLPPQADLRRALPGGPAAVEAATLDRLVALGSPRHTRDQAAGLAGVASEELDRLWRALGFPDPGDEPVFTDSDVEMLGRVRQLLLGGAIEVEAAIQLTRVAGQALARIADSQVAALREHLAPEARDGDDVARALGAVLPGLTPTVEHLLSHAWRRHVALAVARVVCDETTSGSPREREVGIGFADLVGFTALTAELDQAALAAAICRFEELAFDAVSAHGGRVVKVLGDEVMFVAETVEAVSAIALDVAEAIGVDEGLPNVRVGVAYGPALLHEGDYYGRVSNLASRAVQLARPGAVLVDQRVRDLMEGDERYLCRALRPRRLKGLGWTKLFVIQRVDPDR